MFGFHRTFYRGAIASTAAIGFAVTLLVALVMAPQSIASPISLLDSDVPAPPHIKSSDFPTTDQSMVRSIGALPSDTGGGASKPLGASAAQTGLLSPPASGAAPSSGSLREVLRTIVTLHQADRKPPSLGPAAPASGDRDADDSGIDLRKLILDSEVAGTMLRSIVDIKSSDGRGATFSILGLGNFALDVAPDVHAAIVSELSSGMGFHMSLLGDGRGYDGYPQATVNGNGLPDMPHTHINLVRAAWAWFLDFLNSPFGALVSMTAAIALFVWVCAKSVVFLQRRASRYE